MNAAGRILRSLAPGALAGLAALALDASLAALTLGYRVPLSLRFAAAYLAAGALAGAVVESARWLGRRPPWGAVRTGAAALAVVYAAPIAERVGQAVAVRAGTAVTIAACAVVLAGYCLFIVLLRRLIGTTRACTLAALGVAAGLAVNRNLVHLVLEPKAVAADVLLVVAVLALALAVRSSGGRRAASMAVAAAVLAVLAVVVAPAAPPAPEGPRAAAAAPRPHLLLLSIDTLRQDVFRAVVDETAEGRAFRAALGHAAWFDRAIAVAPWTPPSVASIMTGLYPREHGFGASLLDDPGRPLRRLSASVTTLAERLEAHGYRTEAIVANAFLHPMTGIARGFQRYAFLEGPTAKLPLLTVLSALGVMAESSYQPAAVIRRRLAGRAGELAGGRPVFLWLHFMDPHLPLLPHRGLAPDPAARGLSREQRLYRDEVRYTLRELTRAFDVLRAHGLWRDAVLVLVSDHGEMFPEDGRDHLAKRTGHGHALYGELVRIPLVIRPPGGLPADRRVDVLASHTDLHDTVADLLGLEVPRIGRDRVSLAPWLAPEPPSAPLRRTYALMAVHRNGPAQRAVRTDTLKLIHRPGGEPADELYEIAADPHEQHDLAAADGERLAELRELLELAWSRLADASADDARPLEFDEETRRRLRALGYLQ